MRNIQFFILYFIIRWWSKLNSATSASGRSTLVRVLDLSPKMVDLSFSFPRELETSVSGSSKHKDSDGQPHGEDFIKKSSRAMLVSKKRKECSSKNVQLKASPSTPSENSNKPSPKIRRLSLKKLLERSRKDKKPRSPREPLRGKSLTRTSRRTKKFKTKPLRKLRRRPSQQRSD